MGRRLKLQEMQATAAAAKELAAQAERSLAGLAEPPLPERPLSADTNELRHQMEAVMDRYLLLDAQLRQAENTNFRVCIFGSARLRPEDPIYQTVQSVAKSLAQLGVDIVTGGGPGLMEAANRGVREAQDERAKSYGLPIDLPALEEVPNQHLDIKSSHRRFSSRLDEFVRLSHAVIVAPGGIGTTLELMYVWQLLQVGLIERRKVILLGREYWSGLLDWFRRMPLAHRLISPTDFDYVVLADTAAEVCDLLEEEIAAYRSRYPLTGSDAQAADLPDVPAELQPQTLQPSTDGSGKALDNGRKEPI